MDRRNGSLNQGVPKKCNACGWDQVGSIFVLLQKRAAIPTLCVLGVDMLWTHTWGQFDVRERAPLFHAQAVWYETVNEPAG